MHGTASPCCWRDKPGDQPPVHAQRTSVDRALLFWSLVSLVRRVLSANSGRYGLNISTFPPHHLLQPVSTGLRRDGAGPAHALVARGLHLCRPLSRSTCRRAQPIVERISERPSRPCISVLQATPSSPCSARRPPRLAWIPRGSPRRGARNGNRQSLAGLASEVDSRIPRQQGMRRSRQPFTDLGWLIEDLRLVLRTAMPRPEEFHPGVVASALPSATIWTVAARSARRHRHSARTSLWPACATGSAAQGRCPRVRSANGETADTARAPELEETCSPPGGEDEQGLSPFRRHEAWVLASGHQAGNSRPCRRRPRCGAIGAVAIAPPTSGSHSGRVPDPGRLPFNRTAAGPCIWARGAAAPGVTNTRSAASAVQIHDGSGSASAPRGLYSPVTTTD